MSVSLHIRRQHKVREAEFLYKIQSEIKKRHIPLKELLVPFKVKHASHISRIFSGERRLPPGAREALSQIFNME